MSKPLESDLPEEMFKEGDDDPDEEAIIEEAMAENEAAKDNPTAVPPHTLVPPKARGGYVGKIKPSKVAAPTDSVPLADDGAKKNPRKMRTGSKGTAIELKAKKHLEDEGWVVHRCVRTGIKRGPFYMSQSNDVFGCVDLVAKKRGQPTLWIQVTADSGIGRKKDDLLKIPWTPGVDDVRIWRWVGGSHTSHKTTGAPIIRQYFIQYFLQIVDSEKMAYDGPSVDKMTLDFVKDDTRNIYLGAKKPRDSFQGSQVR